MQTENWKKVKELLNEVLPLNTVERKKIFEQSKVSGEIRKEVESLLLFEKESEDLMHLSAVEFLKDFIDSDDENTLIGQNIGVYKIVRELGYGGMGAVYLAERTDGKFEQKVALKLLKREMNTAALRRRFSQEREILASLQHPNIAGLLDAGTTNDKIPYIAMEYVEGLPIDDYCNKHRLNVEQRLDLFREVCATVDFAHRNLVVHRDLKPSNVLVTEDGKPKLLDFGISKILSTEFEQSDISTVTKMGVMTPSYASPEQIQNKSVTTATDIYSLGVILFELLSGHRPFEAKESDLKEIYKAVIETDPPLPSSMAAAVSREFKEITEAKTAIQSDKKEKRENLTLETEAAKMRHTNPQTMNLNSNSIRGDLDNIVLKALRKEPERRYSSAENLAEDIKRHLRGLPVTARPNTFSYRTSKFINRNKASVFAGVLIFLAIIGGIIATLWQARVAQAERAKAERRFNDVRQLANSFLFDLSPKIEKLPGSTEARKELVSLALEYLDNLSIEAGNDAELQRELAAAYEKVGDVQGNPYNANIGDVRNAMVSYEKALNIRQKLYEQEPQNLTAMKDLADSFARMSDIKTQVGTQEEVKEFNEKELDLREKILERDPNDFEARKNLAASLRRRGRSDYKSAKYGEAVEYYKQTADIYEQLLREKPENSQVIAKYGEVIVDGGDAEGWNNETEKAQVTLQKGMDILIPLAEKYPNDSGIQQIVFTSYRKQSAGTMDTGNKEKGVAELRKALEIGQKLLKADPENIRAKRDIAWAMRSVGSETNSFDELLSALALMKEVSASDPKNPTIIFETALTYLYIAGVYEANKNYEIALENFEKAIDGYQNALDLDPKNVTTYRSLLSSREDMAEVYVKFAEKENRRDLLQKALDNYRIALEGFNKLKSEGTLGEYDMKFLPKIEAAIKKVEDKLGK